MIPQQQQQMTPQLFAQQMTGLKRRISQVAGETQQMTSDAMSQTFEQVMHSCQQLFQQIQAKDSQIAEITVKLETCYQAHPELKITMEAEEKKAKEKETKGKAKKV